MSIREIDLAQFSEFARQQIEAGRGDVSLSSLVEQWERRQQSIQVHESPEHRNTSGCQSTRVCGNPRTAAEGVVRIGLLTTSGF